jgi:hypothetical protein
VWFLGGHREQSDINAQAADDRASELARAFAQVATLSVRVAAEELTRRGVPTPSGGRWHPTQVARVRARLASRGDADRREARDNRRTK